jgi:outer membrane receptor protein involved in Fe transport
MLSASALTGLIFSLPAIAQAQTTAGTNAAQLGDVVVTARRRSESLQNVPIAVNALSTAKIDAAGIENLSDVAKLTPSLMFDKFFGPQDNRVTIRGLPSTRGRSPAGILLDGIDVTTEALATAGGGNLADVRIADFDRIEVVEGPQSALYGRSAFGGAINYITKEPGKTFGGYAQIDAATYGKVEGRGAVDLPVNDDLAFRVNGMVTHFPGFYKNSVTGDPVGGWDDSGLALGMRYQPNDSFKLVGHVTYAHAKDAEPAQSYYGINDGLAANVPMPASAAGQQVGLPATTLPAYVSSYPNGAIKNLGLPVMLMEDPSNLGHDFPGAQTDTLIASLHASWRLGYVTAESWTGGTDQNGTTFSDVGDFGRPLIQAALPSPGGLADYSGTATHNGFWDFDITTHLVQFNQELRLSHSEGQGFHWAIGGLFWYEQVNQPNRSLTIYSLPNGASPFLDVEQMGGHSPIASVNARSTYHYSGYIMADYDITSQLNVEAEARFADERLDYLFGQNVSVGTTTGTGTVPFVLTGTSSTAHSETKYVAPKVSVNYKPLRDILFYASVGEGVKPGGFSQVGGSNPALGQYNPELLWSYEAGAKTTLLDRRLRLNASIFHMDYYDKQESVLLLVPISVNPQGNLALTKNIGQATINGLEMNFAAVLTPEFTLTGAYTHLNTDYTNYVVTSNTPLTIDRAGRCQLIATGTDGNTCQLNLDGNQLEDAPPDVWTLELDYRHQFSDDLSLVAEADGNYHSKRYIIDTNNWWLNPYYLMNMSIGLEAQKWTLTAYMTNVLNDKSIENAEYVNDNVSGTSGLDAMAPFLPDPRQIGIRARYKF